GLAVRRAAPARADSPGARPVLGPAAAGRTLHRTGRLGPPDGTARAGRTPRAGRDRRLRHPRHRGRTVGRPTASPARGRTAARCRCRRGLDRRWGFPAPSRVTTGNSPLNHPGTTLIAATTEVAPYCRSPPPRGARSWVWSNPLRGARSLGVVEPP